ncbi:MAG: hypothetical protein MJE66_12175 [Proteobacteria bacterium]|nr:hypothetical protein [Pseudomonadota bacterium]
MSLRTHSRPDVRFPRPFTGVHRSLGRDRGSGAVTYGGLPHLLVADLQRLESGPLPTGRNEEIEE